MTKLGSIFEILRKFKERCSARGWKTCEKTDWVQTDNEYHNVILTREVHPAAFRKIISNGKCIVPEDMSYKVVSTSYTAWLFSETPSGALVNIVVEDPAFAQKIALYDLSSVVKGKNVCKRLNNTESAVFKEFDNYLKRDLELDLKPFSSEQSSQHQTPYA